MSEIERKTEHEIAPVFTDRWSPRSFTGETSARRLDAALRSCSLAPSSYNYQPWRFL